MESKPKRTLTFEEEQKKNIKKITKNTIKMMVDLKVYKVEFNPIITVYARMQSEYEHISFLFLDNDYNYDEETDTGGSKKSPIVTTLEAYRKDILAYAAQLGLTPVGLRKIYDGSMKPPQAKSPVEKFLEREAGKL